MTELLEKYFNFLQNPEAIKRWYDSRGHKINPWKKLDREEVKENYPDLDDKELELYGKLKSFPYHDTMSMMDTKLFFRGLSKEKI